MKRSVNSVTIVGLLILLTGAVLMGVALAPKGLSVPCVESVVSLTPGVVLCGSPTSSLSGIQYGSVWLVGGNYPVLVTTSASTLTFYYQLGTGLSLTSFSADWCTSSTMVNGFCPDGSPTLSVTDDGVQSSGIGSFTAVAPSTSAGATYYFEGHIKDSSGAGYSTVGAVAYVLTSYSMTVDVTDLQTGLPIQGAQVNLFQNGGNIYATQDTDSSGAAPFNVPFYNNGYYAIVNALHYTGLTTSVLQTSQPSQTVSVKLESNDLATITYSTVLEVCTTTLSNGQTTTISFTGTVIYLTSSGGSSTYSQTTGSSPCTQSVIPPGPNPTGLSSTLGIVGFITSLAGVTLIAVGARRSR